MTKRSDSREIGRRIMARRVQRGLSQGTVSRRAGLDPSYLSRIETGKVTPTVRTAMRIAGALRCTLDDLVGPSPSEALGRPCPVSSSGECLMDSLEAAGGPRKKAGRRSGTARELRLLKEFAALLQEADAGLMSAMESLIRELGREKARSKEDDAGAPRG